MTFGTQKPDDRALWSPYLEPDEELLWTSRPSAALALPTDGRLIEFLGACVVMAVGVSSISGFLPLANRGEIAAPSWYGWLFLAIGAVNGFVPLFWASWHRWNSRYAISNRRALMLSRSIGIRTLKSWQIRTLPSVELVLGWQKSVWLDRTKGGIFSRRRNKNIGFEMIPDAEAVHRLILKIQREASL